MNFINKKLILAVLSITLIASLTNATTVGLDQYQTISTGYIAISYDRIGGQTFTPALDHLELNLCSPHPAVLLGTAPVVESIKTVPYRTSPGAVTLSDFDMYGGWISLGFSN